VQCDGVCRAVSSLQTEWVLSFRDKAGELLAAIEKLQLHVLPAPSQQPVARVASGA
jgi:hypothetical protein